MSFTKALGMLAKIILLTTEELIKLVQLLRKQWNIMKAWVRAEQYIFHKDSFRKRICRGFIESVQLPEMTPLNFSGVIT
jgi:predicted aspartyl protease